MTDWNPQNIHPSMRVYTLDGHELGHIAKVYEDSFLVHKGYFFPTDRYIPYSAIDSIENDRVQLSMSADEANKRSGKSVPIMSIIWVTQPNYFMIVDMVSMILSMRQIPIKPDLIFIYGFYTLNRITVGAD